MPISLRPYQAIDVAGIRSEYARGHRAVLYVAPTGSGKTVTFSYIASEMAKRQKRCWILVHRQELLSQTSRALSEFSVDHGLISPHYAMDARAPLQVASVQTLVRRLDKLQAPDLIIADEGHHSVSPSWRSIIDACPTSKLLGVSATPERLDGRGLGEVFQAMVIGLTVADLTRDGYLAPAVAFVPPQLLDMTGVAKRAGDYAKDEMAKRVDEPTITGDAVAHYSRLCPGVPAIAFCASVLHAEHVAAQFRDAGFCSTSVDGELDDRERKRRLDGLANGQVNVLTSCDLVSEGLDIVGVTAAIMLRPTQSLALARQQMGRALRPAPGKRRAYLIDHVGNILRHGLPTEEIAWTLEGGAAKRRGDAEKTLRLRQCPKCYMVHAPAPRCAECGHIYEIEPRTVKQVEGDLVELQISEMRDKAARQLEVQRAETLGELIAIGKRRGYKSPYFWAKKLIDGRRSKQRASA